MSEHDPLDDLLRRAFAADRDRTPPARVADRVVARIRTRQRIRTGALGGAGLAGLAVLAMSAPPILTGAMETLIQSLLTGWEGDTTILVLVVVLGAAGLMVLDGELS